MASKGIERLYRKIPKFSCIDGCTDCCGPVIFTRSEWAAIPVKELRPEDSLDCPYANDGCEIYDDRPFLCRLFGATEEPRLKCPHGRGPGRKLNRRETRKLTQRYVRAGNYEGIEEGVINV